MSLSKEFDSLLSADGLGALMVGPAGHILFANKQFASALGYRSDQLVGQEVGEVIVGKGGLYPQCWKRVDKPLQRYAIRRADNSLDSIPLLVAAVGDHWLLLGDLGASGCAPDLSCLSFAPVAHHLPAALMVTDPDPSIVSVNRAFCELTGYREDEVIGKNPRLLQSGRHNLHYYDAMWSELALRGEWSGEIWDQRRNGEVFPAWATIRAVTDKNGQVENYIANLVDLSDRQRSNEEIHYLAYYDLLTGLPNRHLLADRLEMAMRYAKRSRNLLAIMFIDIDNFKEINDEYGHAMGDQLLLAFSQRLRTCVRSEDTLARFAGDEFILLVGGVTSRDAVAQVAQKLLTAVRQSISVAECELVVTSSIGVALYPDDGLNADALLSAADEAMYRVKHDGRNSFCFH